MPWIFLPMGVGGFSARGLRGRVIVESGLVVCHRGFCRPLDHRSARRAPDGGDVGPREGQEGEEGDEAVHGARCRGWCYSTTVCAPGRLAGAKQASRILARLTRRGDLVMHGKKRGTWYGLPEDGNPKL